MWLIRKYHRLQLLIKTDGKKIWEIRYTIDGKPKATTAGTYAITGWGVWVFHGARDIKRHVNKESGNKALLIMGFVDEVKGRKQTLHSFRGTFRSLTETYATQQKMEHKRKH